MLDPGPGQPPPADEGGRQVGVRHGGGQEEGEEPGEEDGEDEEEEPDGDEEGRPQEEPEEEEGREEEVGGEGVHRRWGSSHRTVDL